VRDLRGNVDTRLRRLADGDYDALVLAMAGLMRLGRSAEGSPLDELVPDAGQGCLAIEARTGDEQAAQAAALVTDPEALTCLTAERALVAALDASCHTPVGAYAGFLDQDELQLTAFVGMPDGSHWIRDTLASDARDPSGLGEEAARRLLAAGARELLEAAERSPLSRGLPQ
jgi:hydroxymethylbilane synthase